MDALLSGFALGLSLILAIGAQNAFVLRQGLRRAHVFAVCLACAASDAALIALGVSSFAAVSALLPWVEPVLRFGGAAFLLVYAALALRSAIRGGAALRAGGGAGDRLGPTLATCLLLTWANPHVWLDTVVLLGSISARWGEAAWTFGAGAMAASFVFFFALGYGARALAPLFARPAAWRVLDACVAAVMVAIAVSLLAGG